ncbi:MAG TPA: hypothetical protein VEH07_07750 [Alphaproteobacteria bacterium]|nr:hypothetical protein [Alphaproteobacteria bacterium]
MAEKGAAAKREYQTLDEAAIIEMIDRLKARVSERFPTRGLAQTAGFLADLARKTSQESARLRHPNWLVRLLAIAAIAAAAYGFYSVHGFVHLLTNPISFPEFAQGLDATFNLLILCGLTVAFLFGIDSRLKRRKALDGLYRLRAIAHVIDMHQLTKDPASVLGLERTAASPTRDLTHDQLLRYLDYCAEMLSMIGKLAALYAQHFPDLVVISAVNDVEALTTNLSRKIWQKIVIVQGEPRD